MESPLGGLSCRNRSSVGGDDDLTGLKTTPSSPRVERTLREFRRHAPVEEASTPPSAWYTDAEFADFEIDRVFGRCWQAVGHIKQMEEPGSFFTGRVGKTRYVVCKDGEGQIRAFHNVCRHHAAAVASGSGCTHSFVCPYHGWTYGLDGRLQKASRLAGIRNFSARENGLVPIRTATWGPFVLISLAESKASEASSDVEEGWLGSAGPTLSSAGIDSTMQHVATREYVIKCNWKVYCDNYLDGGYHVPHAHSSLAACLDLPSYSTSLLERVSIQSCGAAKESGLVRVGNVATYAFVYPNFMINRYGPWMDTNLVIPISMSECRVIFDWFLEPSLVHDKEFIDSSIADSEVVQKEDIILCEDVQNGLSSPAYDVGRYAPRVEQAMHHFHCLIYDDLSAGMIS